MAKQKNPTAKQLKESGHILRGVTFDVYVSDKEMKQKVINEIRAFRLACRKVAYAVHFAECLNAEIVYSKEGYLRVMARQHEIKRVNRDGSPKIDPKTGKQMTAKQNDARAMLADLFRYSFPETKVSKDGYEFYRVLQNEYPDWDNQLLVCIAREVERKLGSKDPHLGGRRGYWALNLMRNPPLFNYASMPIDHQPMYVSSSDEPDVQTFKRVRLYKHTIELFWNKEIGWVSFKLDTLDDNRKGLKKESNGVKRRRKKDRSNYYRWKMLRAGKMPFGQVRIKEVDGRLKISLAYYAKAKNEMLDKDRVMECQISATENKNKRKTDLFVLRVIKGHKPTTFPLDSVRNRTLSVEAALDYLRGHAVRKSRVDTLRRECGHKRGKGAGSANKDALAIYTARLQKLTKNRTAVCMQWNRRWAAAIVDQAVAWECRTIRIFDVPQKAPSKLAEGEDPEQYGMLGHPWQWAQFVSFLQQRVQEYGITIEITDKGKFYKALRSA